jgi:hypothetical protein
MFITGESPTMEQLVDRWQTPSSCPAAAASPPNFAFALLGHTRGASSRTGRRRRADHSPTRLQRTTWQPEPPNAQGISWTSTHAPSGRSPRPISAALHRRASSGRRSRICVAGRRSSSGKRRRARGSVRRGDVVPAGHVLPARVGARLASFCSCTTSTGRSTGATAARWPATLAGVLIDREI